jgi:hypothetical protein
MGAKSLCLLLTILSSLLSLACCQLVAHPVGRSTFPGQLPSNSTLYSPYEATEHQHTASTTPGSSPGILQSPAQAALPLGGILFMVCAETACLPKVSAFLRRTVQPGTALTHIIKDPTAVGICTYFETPGILVGQQISERSRNLRLHPIPILLQRHHFQVVSLCAF